MTQDSDTEFPADHPPKKEIVRKVQASNAKPVVVLRTIFIPMSEAGIAQITSHSLNVKSELQQEFVGPDVQRLCEPEKNLDGGGALAAFDAPHIIRMNLGFLCKGLLAQSRLLSAPENCFANDLALKWFEHSSYGNRIDGNAPHTQRVGYVRLCLHVERRRKYKRNHWTALDLRGIQNMKETSDTEFESLLRSLVLSPEESLRRDALKEKIKAHIAPLFEGNDTTKNHNEFCAG